MYNSQDYGLQHVYNVNLIIQSLKQITKLTTNNPLVINV